MPALPVTALYAGISGLWLLALAYEVVRRRHRHSVSLGSGGVPDLERAIRAHGNAVETLPLGLILIGLAEGMGMPAPILHLSGLALLAGRAMHGLHFLAFPARRKLRFWGMMLTIVPLAGLSAGLVGHALVRLVFGS